MRRLLAAGEPEAALAFCRGDLLQELDDYWVIEVRADLDRDIAVALADLTQQARAAGDPAAALAWARRRAALCPLDEPTGADLIRALIDAGEAPAALEAFARLQQRLGSELGVPASAATAALIEPFRTVPAEMPIGSADLAARTGGRRAPRVLLVLTRRHLPGRQDLDAVLGALRSRGALAAEIRVGRLTDEATRQLVMSVADLPGAAISQIVKLAAGSPLLAAETARAASAVDLATGDLTIGLVGAVRLATSRLSGPSRVFVEFAAAAGRDLDRHEVAALPLPNPALAAAEALGSGLLRTDDGRTGFRHALLADAVYQEIPDPIRTRLHGELAQLLRKRAPQPGPHGRRARPGPRATEIARHLRLARQDDQAVSCLVRAARDARGVAAMAEAANFLTEALQIGPDDPELLVELAEVEAFRGLLDDSDRAFDRALEQISPQDSGALISAWLRRGRWLRGGVCHPRESRRSYQNALDVLDRDPGYDLPARAEALAGMAWAEAVAGDPAAVDELLAETDAILGGGSPGDLLAHDIGVARGHALIRAGQFTDCFAPLIAASAAAGRAGRPDMAYSCLSNAASAAAAAGELGRALDFADRCLPLVVPNGLLRLSVYAQTARSAILRRMGRPAEARRACDAAAGYADRVGLAELDGLVSQERGLLALAARDPATR